MTEHEPKASTATLARLKAVVAAYGAAPERWPEHERVGLVSLARAHAGAPWMAEARDLDGLLDLAPGASLGATTPQMIVAQAMASDTADAATVVEMPRRLRGVASGLGPAALLAASLAAGFWIGATGDPSGLFEPETPFAALAMTEEVAGAQPVDWWNSLMAGEDSL